MKRTTCWLASYPKSGNTWMRMVWEAVQSGSAVGINTLQAPGAIAASRQNFDTALGVSSSDLTNDEVEMLRPRADDLGAAAQPGPTLRKVHDALAYGPTGDLVVSVASAFGALYLIRDPRDVAISFARHMGLDLDTSVDRLIRGASLSSYGHYPGVLLDQRLSRWDDHVGSWVDQDVLAVHIVRYEDCLASPVATFGAALRFSQVHVSDEAVAAAVDSTKFTTLARQEAEEGFREGSRTGSQFFRAGRSGQWIDEMPRPLVARIEAEFGDTMARFGYLAG